MMDLQMIQAGWDDAAREDAMFNIITHADRINGGWTAPEFFAHGQAEIDKAMARLDTLEVHPRRGRALDFGCGVGRLTQALAEYFKRADGVDVSPEMVDQARSHNRHPGRVEYHLNTQRIPFRAGTFDLIYTMIVLQHMPRNLQRGYVKEFFRVLKPGGVAMIDIPDGPDYLHPNEWLSMYGTPRVMVEEWIDDAGGRLVDAEPLPEPSVWQHYRYTAVAS
jgi:SAM-dependent methyltransferase